MKNKLLGIASATGISSLAFAFSACKPNGIVILPAENEDPEMKAKWTEIQPVLTGHEELYYVKEFKEGVEIQDGELKGNLLPILRERDFDQTEKMLAQRKFTGHAFQIGVGLKAKSDVRYVGIPDESAKRSPSPKISPTPEPLWPHLHLVKQIKESTELVKEVDEILSKPAPPPSKPGP